MMWKEFLNKAKRELSLADHIAYVTLPMTEDKKVYLTIFQHLKDSMLFGIKAYLHKLKEDKIIRMMPMSEKLLFELFFENFELDNYEKKSIIDTINIVDACKKSQMEIKRGENYIVILKDFRTVTINKEKAGELIRNAKKLIKKVEERIENERFGPRPY